jgi:hypothetical protein
MCLLRPAFPKQIKFCWVLETTPIVAKEVKGTLFIRPEGILTL